MNKFVISTDFWLLRISYHIQKPTSYLNSFLRLRRLTILHLFEDAQVCLTTLTWIDRANLMLLLTSNHTPKFKFILQLVREILKLFVQRFLDHNVRPRFSKKFVFFFHWKFEEREYLHIHEKSTYGWIKFLSMPQETSFWGCFCTLLTYRDFFFKNWVLSLTSLYDSLILCKRSEKNWWAFFEVFVANRQGNRQTNRLTEPS